MQYDLASLEVKVDNMEKYLETQVKMRLDELGKKVNAKNKPLLMPQL